MTFGAILKTIFTFLPELVGLIKTLHASAQAGVEHMVLKNRLKKIGRAFEPGKDPRQAAKELNDAFKK